MNTLSYIDLYCERTGPEFWNEPFNAVSNMAFVVSAIASWRLTQLHNRGDIWEKIVIILAGAIGIGSFLFHTFAKGWAELADIIPIWSFVAAYVLLAIYRSTNQDVIRTLRIALIAFVVTLTVSWFSAADISTETNREPVLLNGSIQYAPALLVLFTFTLFAFFRKNSVRHHLAVATAIFCIALTCRTIDQWACTSTAGIGTHFLWHLFNALMIAVLLHAMIVKMPPQPKEAPGGPLASPAA
jgi:hypothetical protein